MRASRGRRRSCAWRLRPRRRSRGREQWRIAGGVLGGGVLVALSAWAIRGAVDGFLGTGGGRPSPAVVLVKFFTRHAILALAAYGMMVRLHLDPVGMLAGVSSLAIASGVTALQRFQRVS